MYVEWGSIMEYFGILLSWITGWHEGNTCVFDVDTSSHVVRSDFIDLHSESAVTEFVSFWGRTCITNTAQYCVSEGCLLVVQTQWNFWCLALPACNHTSHYLTTSCTKQTSGKKLQQQYLPPNEKHKHYCQTYCVFFMIKCSSLHRLLTRNFIENIVLIVGQQLGISMQKFTSHPAIPDDMTCASLHGPPDLHWYRHADPYNWSICSNIVDFQFINYLRVNIRWTDWRVGYIKDVSFLWWGKVIGSKSQ
jgi:hypothetical protein